MTLSEQQIKDIILNNPNKTLVNLAKEKNKLYRMHMYGIMMDSYISIIDGFEEKPMRALRAKYARSNKDLFSRLSRPVDKVFSARGGSMYLYLSDAVNKRALAAIGNVRDGYHVKKWVEKFWKPHYMDDPNGMIFMEIGNGDNYAAGRAYPTYKSITSVYDYSPRGINLDYVAFNVTKAEKIAAGLKPEANIYRVVDDAFDYYVERKNRDVNILDGHTIPNYFMSVPGILCSDIVDPNNDGLMLSFFDDITALADEFLLKGSIKITHDFMHAFPKYWEYADSCDKCGGTGEFDNATCTECKGSGKSLMLSVSKAKALAWPTDKETPLVAPNVAGYVEPSQAYYEIATSDLAMLEDNMNFTVWGANSRKRTVGLSTNGNQEQTQTATEIIENLQPQHDRLYPISDHAERCIKFIVDNIIQVEIAPTYSGSSVNLGRRYLTENPDVVWQRYVDAKKAGASVTILDEMYEEFIENKYSGDPVSMDVMLKLMLVEPFVHKTVEEVQHLNLSEDDYLCKVYYGEWLNTIEDSYIISATVDEMKQALKDYVSDKQLAPTEPTKIGFK